MVVKQGRKRPIAEINVVPYIDVMLVLLVIFMITAPLLTQGVNVELPQAQAGPITNKEQEPLIVSIDVNGNYYLNTMKNPEQPLTAEALQSQVATELQLAKQHAQKMRAILVKGDKKVDYGRVVSAVLLLQHAGATSVGLVTQQPDNF